MKRLSTICFTLILCGCGVNTEKRTISTPVNHYGVLREIMMEQKLTANADLDSLKDQTHLYGLGAVEGLAGEILILDGIAYLSVADSLGVSVEQGFDRKASLLVTSNVSLWQELPLDINWTGLESLQIMIAEAASQQGIDTQKPFPFIVQGTFNEISWHVINATRAKAQNHEAYKEAGTSGILKQAEGKMLGFYSEQHQGVFTHLGSYLHLHFINEAKDLMGHVDDLKHNGKIKLLLPKKGTL